MMLAKRLLVWALSAGTGLVITVVLLAFAHTLESKISLTLYGYGYLAGTALLIGAAVLPWIDHVMKTGIIPD